MKKKTTTRKTIRQIVREEVAMAIHEVIDELKQPSLSSTGQPIQEKKNFSSNSVLNDVLNETAMGDDWKTLGGGKLDSSNMSEILTNSYGNMMADTSNPNGSLAVEMGVNPDEAPDFLKKDYRAVMKAVDKKQGK